MKVKLFTHTDLDGVGCAVVAKRMYKDISITYCNYDEIDYEVSRFIDKESRFYDLVLITDISVDEYVAKEIDEYIGHKTKLIDHHATAEWLNKYKWANVNPLHEDNVKSSGTSMLFDYLNQPDGLYDFVEKVRRYDTWEWSTKYNDEHAKQLNDLLYIVGREKFFNRFVSNPSIELTDSEKLILDIEQDKINHYIGKKKKQVKEKNILGYKAGVVFAEQYSSQLGNELAKEYVELDFIAIINTSSQSISYRGIKDYIDLGKDVAKVFGGGGHPKAAGSQIDEKHLDNFIFDLFNKQ